MASIVVSGRVLRRPSGEEVAAHLHYLIGLRKLGHRVIYLEQRGTAGAGGQDGRAASAVPQEGLVLMRNLLRRCRVDVPVVWVDPDAGLVGGMVWAQLRKRLSKADLLLDLGGHCWLEERSLAGRRALVDMTAGARFQTDGRQLDHDVFFSYRRHPEGLAEAEWLPTIPPVVPRLWYGPPADREMLMQAAAEPGALRGASSGHGQLRLLELPDRAPARLGIALSEHQGELGAILGGAGWTVADAGAIDASLSTYRAHVVGSQAAISIRDRSCGEDRGIWFSPRDACFLAAGRPVIVGDPSIDSWLPTGNGLLSFGDLDQAAEAIARVNGALSAHALAARAMAQRVFHYRVVLPSLIERALPSRLQAAA